MALTTDLLTTLEANFTAQEVADIVEAFCLNADHTPTTDEAFAMARIADMILSVLQHETHKVDVAAVALPAKLTYS